tara:strand:+ start:14561 stop:15235 length:675 start_codon:yes stop_codon:yes gene_type:complete
MELKDRLKMMLGIEENNDNDVSLMLQARLEDGTIISSDADEMTTGIVINVVAEDGSVFPLAEGTYILEDGGEFSVDSEGVVTEYNPSEEIEDVEEDVEEVETEEEVEDVEMSDNSAILDSVAMVVKELLEEVSKELAHLKSEFESMQSEKIGLEEQVETIEKEKEELSKQVSDLSSEPDAEPLKTTKFAKEVFVKSKYNKTEKPVKSWKEMTIAERISFQFENK